MTADIQFEELARQAAPKVFSALARHFPDFDAVEDAVQEALLAATAQWPRDGMPDNPVSWLITVASRRMTDHLRSDEARQRREVTVASQSLASDLHAPAADAVDIPGQDDTLLLLFLCCHPALTPASQVALTLRAVGGLSTAQIARAFMVPEATLAQRISRAKQRIKDAGARFGPPAEHERASRLSAVLHVLYLIFNEGYTATSGTALQRCELTGEAIRLTREVHRLLPDEGEAAGLLALMLLTDARLLARTRPDGTLVPLAEQDRTLWNQDRIAEGIAIVTRALARRSFGPYQIQGAIAAVHAKSPRAEDTDWRQILALYELLEQTASNPMVTLNHAVATAMVHGHRAGLDMLAPLETDDRMRRHHRLHAVRAHLLETAGDTEGALASYQKAARLTTSQPEQHYLQAKASRLSLRLPRSDSNPSLGDGSWKSVGGQSLFRIQPKTRRCPLLIPDIIPVRHITFATESSFTSDKCEIPLAKRPVTSPAPSAP